MTRRATVSAPANIALVKYWGADDPDRVIPCNPSISITLEVCRSVTTVEVRDDVTEDRVWLEQDGRLEPAPAGFADRVRGHLDTLRERLGDPAAGAGFLVATRNSFPAAAGFAALACAVVRALGKESPEPLSVLARLSGSGSAARSVLGGYVQWPPPGGPADGPAVQLEPAGHWDLRDVIALVQSGPKDVSSLEGHRRAPTSPYFARRLELLPDRLAAVRNAIGTRDLNRLGPLVERDAIDLHAIAMTSDPPIFYWAPATVALLAAVRDLRRRGISAWATMDAGANVHVLCEPADEPAVAERLTAVPGVSGVIRDRIGDGPRDEPDDLLELPGSEDR